MMDEDVPYEPPSAEEEEAFLAAPAHILARITRDLFADAEAAQATLAVTRPMLSLLLSPCPLCHWREGCLPKALPATSCLP